MTHWITDSQDEQSLEELFRDADQIHVPVFQRSYIWTKNELDQLNRDIQLVRDAVEDSQFLGAVVTYERERVRSVVGRLRALDVVDGQQRLLTLYIMVLAIAEQIASVDKVIAAEIVQEFLLLKQRRGLDVNTRIVPAFSDRAQFQLILNRLSSPAVLGSELADNPPAPPAASGDADGNLLKQYNRIARQLRDQLSQKSPEERLPSLRQALDTITRRLTFVHLQLTDASVATKIFERLNYRGVRVGILDLVRNEVFSRVDDAAEAIRVYEQLWKPFEDSFEGLAEDFFFPYCLLHNSNTKKSEIFTELRKIWGDASPSDIVSHMLPYRAPFLAVTTGANSYGPEIGKCIVRLARFGSPSAVFPFVMGLLHAVDEGEASATRCVALLEVLESFLVRRAIVGFEPTGLHAVFKSLWNEIRGDPTVGEMIRQIRTRPTIQWPTDRDVQSAVEIRPLGKANVCSYLLVEYDHSFPGDHPVQEPTIEHVLPQSYDAEAEWATIYTREQHKELVDTWANLLPLTSPLNSSMQAKSYSIKRQRYREESMFITPRAVARDYAEWTPDTIRARSRLIAEWAVARWPWS